MTRIERRQKALWRRWLEILGMVHPELTSNFEPGWTAALSKDGKPGRFNAKPRKRRAA